MKEKLKNPFAQQYLFEILLPLVGYFFFDWSLLIIALFYLIDQLGSESSFIRRFIAVRKSENQLIWKPLVSGILFFLLAFSIEIFLLLKYFGEVNSNGTSGMYIELLTFAKEELWILFPLIILMHYIRDQFTFFMPRRYLQKVSGRFLYWHLAETSAIVVLVAGGINLLSLVVIPEGVILFIFLAIKITFDFTLGKSIEQKSIKR